MAADRDPTDGRILLPVGPALDHHRAGDHAGVAGLSRAAAEPAAGHVFLSAAGVVGVHPADRDAEWWSSFGLPSTGEWTFATFAMILLQTILLYMTARAGAARHTAGRGDRPEGALFPRGDAVLTSCCFSASLLDQHDQEHGARSRHVARREIGLFHGLLVTMRAISLLALAVRRSPGRIICVAASCQRSCSSPISRCCSRACDRHGCEARHSPRKSARNAFASEGNLRVRPFPHHAARRFRARSRARHHPGGRGRGDRAGAGQGGDRGADRRRGARSDAAVRGRHASSR